MRRSIGWVLCVALFQLACSDAADTPARTAEPAPPVAPAQASPPPPPAPAQGAPTAAEVGPAEIAIITLQGGGEIELRFLPAKAPRHVANFKALAKRGFYDGTTFHRVIPDFMIQGGDPNTRDDDRRDDGLGGPGYTLPAEFNDVAHRRGIVSMARRSDPNSAGSQFFIMVADAPRGSRDWSQVLDGQYTVFGEVTRGMDVVDAIVSTPHDARDRPLRDQRIAMVRILPAP